MANESMKDIAKIVKGTLKQKYPNYSFSVSSKEYPASLDIVWYKADFNPFTDIANRTMLNTNVYYIDETKGLTAKGLEVLKDIYNTAIQFQESYGDKYHKSTKFYLDIDLGTFDKPFTVVESQKEPANVTTPTTSTTTSSSKGKGWDWGDLIRGNNGWTLYSKILPDGRQVYNLVKEKATPPNKEKWNEIRGELSTETGFKWSPRSQSFQYWGNLYNKIDYLELLDKIFAIMGKYYGFDKPKVETSTKQDLTSKSAATAFDIVYRENTQDFDLINDYTMFAERMTSKYVMNDEQWDFLLSEFNKKGGNKEFVLNESYKSIPDNPKLEYVTINWAEGKPEYTNLFPKTFKSFKQASKFIADNQDDNGTTKHSVEWKYKFDDYIFKAKFDIGRLLNPKEWLNLWAKDYLSLIFYNISAKLYNEQELKDIDSFHYGVLGKDGLEITKEEFDKIVKYNNVSRKEKDLLPKTFSLFDEKEEQVVTPEMIQKQIDSLSILAKYGDELAAKKIKLLQILLKK